MTDLPLDDWQAIQVSSDPRSIWQLESAPSRQEWASQECAQQHIQQYLWLCLDTDYLWVYQYVLQRHWLTRLSLHHPTQPTQHWLGDALLTENIAPLRLELFHTHWSARQILSQIQFRYRQRMLSQPFTGYQQMTVELHQPSEYWFIQEQSMGSHVLRVTYAN
ncbi:hypothetical protein CWE22_11835 [Pseudidiomarina aestuarii]|uniref:Uncharacterized protein n=1 Tax=Pseudidiomarina aestuarii TaxID=624146 RepID=A0A7Z6ZRK2_9GAMM|nr:hypothetical protein [Pseudidiomarina aestuarii]RUO37918.1 hypothetical protein CWE22_11835 [Pseudidiomarina aestuarii]